MSETPSHLTHLSLDTRFLPADIARVLGAHADPAWLAVLRPVASDAGPAAAAAAIPWIKALAAAVGALTAGILDLKKAIEETRAQLSSIIEVLMREMVTIIKQILDEKFTEERMREAAHALGRIQYQISFAAHSPNEAEQLEKLLHDVSGFAEALDRYAQLNTERDGLGIPGYALTATIQLGVMNILRRSGSRAVSLTQIQAVRSDHEAKLKAAIDTAKSAIRDSYRLYGNYHGWILGQHPGFPPVTRTVEEVDWGAEHPLRSTPFGIRLAKLYLGTAMKNRYAAYGWSHTAQSLEAVVSPAQANEIVRSRIPEMQRYRDEQIENALAKFDADIGIAVTEALVGWKRIRDAA